MKVAGSQRDYCVVLRRTLNLKLQIYTLRRFLCLKRRESVDLKGPRQAWRLESGHLSINQHGPKLGGERVETSGIFFFLKKKIWSLLDLHFLA